MITNKLIYLGASIIVVGFFEVAWLVVRNRITTARVAAFGVIVIFAGLAVANIGDVTNIVLSLSGGNSLKIQRVVETKAAEVATDTEQVRQLKGQIQDIWQSNNDSAKTDSASLPSIDRMVGCFAKREHLGACDAPAAGCSRRSMKPQRCSLLAVFQA